MAYGTRRISTQLPLFAAGCGKQLGRHAAASVRSTGGVFATRAQKAFSNSILNGRTVSNYIERFNNNLRQRTGRLVRETLSFSKLLDNHIGAIWILFITSYKYLFRKILV